MPQEGAIYWVSALVEYWQCAYEFLQKSIQEFSHQVCLYTAEETDGIFHACELYEAEPLDQVYCTNVMNVWPGWTLMKTKKKEFSDISGMSSRRLVAFWPLLHFSLNSHNYFPSLDGAAIGVQAYVCKVGGRHSPVLNSLSTNYLVSVYVCGRWKSRLLIILILLFVSLWSSWLCIRQGNH